MWGQEQAGVLPCQDIEGDCVCLHPARLTVPHKQLHQGTARGGALNALANILVFYWKQDPVFLNYLS